MSLQLQGSINESSNRNVSGLHTGQGSGGRQTRGRGNGQTRGGQSGHGGRGRGRNIYLGSYSPEQWASLSNEDKQRVRDGRASSSAQNQSQQQQGRGTGGPKRTIGAIAIDSSQQQDDVISAVTQGTSAIGIQNRQTQSQQGQSDTSTAGQSMSRRQRINALATSQRSICQPMRQVSQVNKMSNDVMIMGNCELDSHADTSVVGPTSR